MCYKPGIGSRPTDSRTTLAVTSTLTGIRELALQRERAVSDDSIAPGVALPSNVLIECIARVLNCTIGQSEIYFAISPRSSFCSCSNPKISVERYLGRLHKFFRCSDSALIAALVMLDRFLVACRNSRKEPQRLTTWNIYRLLLTCFVTVVKYNEDGEHRNSYYAQIGGIRCEELNELECVLLSAVDFDIRVDRKEYRHYENALRVLSTLPPPPPKQCIKSAAKNSAMQILNMFLPNKVVSMLK